jgi:hypothetical protein
MSPQARDHSFDELARGLASGSISRAKALKLMGATLVGGALASIPGIAWAKPKPNGVKCNHNHQCESGQCVEGLCGGGEPICNPPCPEGQECTEGVRPGFPPFCRPICTPSCPEECSCRVTADGTTRCISCPGGLCVLRGVSDCLACGDDVCIPGPGGDFPFACAPPCPA